MIRNTVGKERKFSFVKWLNSWFLAIYEVTQLYLCLFPSSWVPTSSYSAVMWRNDLSFQTCSGTYCRWGFTDNNLSLHCLNSVMSIWYPSELALLPSMVSSPPHPPPKLHSHLWSGHTQNLHYAHPGQPYLGSSLYPHNGPTWDSPHSSLYPAR